MYSYHPAGGVTAKRLQVVTPPEDDYWDAVECGGSCMPYENGIVTLDVDYTYDTDGRRTSTFITPPRASAAQSVPSRSARIHSGRCRAVPM